MWQILDKILFLFQNILLSVSQHILFAIGILLISGYLLGKLAEKLKLPVITGYIVAGILLGESIGSVIELEMVKSLRPITEVALGLIALAIGGEFSRAKLKIIGKEVLIIAILQILITFVLVSLVMILLGFNFEFSLLLAAIATATAPAATVAVVQNLRARGKFIDYLYGLVALDDAGSVILFAVIFAFIGTMIAKVNGSSIAGGILIANALWEIILSLLVGVLGGYILHKATRKRQNKSEIMIISLGIVFLTIGIAHPLHISPLLTNIMIGATLVNLSPKNQRISRILGTLTPPIYAAFFTIAGTELQLGIFAKPEILFFGIAFVIVRMIGKYSGVYLGAISCKSDSNVKNYLGICMFPQAGIAIGLVLMIQASPILANASSQIQNLATNMINIIIFSVFVNELIGPPLTKWAIIKGADLIE
ncbi:MAG: cation:proton antiporter [Candidatus Cloacimonetes bacterium]|nr:cation:proton antiporter [Candidatus Cloacimonadota bacterium]MBL7108212.1 cation:proton antiporter [Candidatus Cloacimonadota bacterium]